MKLLVQDGDCDALDEDGLSLSGNGELFPHAAMRVRDVSYSYTSAWCDL